MAPEAAEAGEAPQAPARRRPVRLRLVVAVVAILVVVGSGLGLAVTRPWASTAVCSAQIDHPEWSVARRWDEALLDAIRRALPNPPVHARNLFHMSVAMWDAWAAYDPTATGYLVHEKHTAGDLQCRPERSDQLRGLPRACVPVHQGSRSIRVGDGVRRRHGLALSDPERHDD